MTYYFEDLAVGDEFDCGGYAVTKEEMVAFAERFDPQPFHLDEEAAADSMFGELVASGLYTLCVSARLAITNGFARMANMGGRGMDDLRWYEPVTAGDALSVELRVVEKATSDSHPDRGYVDFRRHVYDADGTEVMTVVSHNIVGRRPDDE